MTPQGFDLVEFTQAQLHDALRAMLPAALKGYTSRDSAAMRAAWSPENPTRFTCYFVSEMVYWYCAPPFERRAMALEVPGDDTLHRFILLDRLLKYPGQTPADFVQQERFVRIDLTCDQFPHDLDYSCAKSRMFLQTGGVGPSKRAQQLATLLKLPDWQRRKLV